MREASFPIHQLHRALERLVKEEAQTQVIDEVWKAKSEWNSERARLQSQIHALATRLDTLQRYVAKIAMKVAVKPSR